MNVEVALKELSKDKRIKAIITKLSNEKYKGLSFFEKQSIYQEFIKILSKKFDLDLNVSFNKKPKELINDVSLFESDETLIINGLDKNPYIYLKDIVLNVLLYKYEDYDFISVGEVYFDSNYTSMLNSLMLYNEDNYPLVKHTIGFIDEIIKDYHNDYKLEYQKSFDKVITKEALKELETVYEIFDDYIKDPFYEVLLNINDKIEELNINLSNKREDLALFSLNNIIISFIDKSKYDNKYSDNLNQYLKMFMEEFFPEYQNEIKIYLTDRLWVNNREIDDEDLVLDVLLQEIKKVEKNNPRIDSIISDDMAKEFNNGKEYSKLEIYFLNKLKELDKNLKDKDLEVINYMEWGKIFIDRSKDNIYLDEKNPFISLSEDEKFVSLVEQYLTSKGENSNLLYEIFKMLNGVYGDNDFKLVIETDVLTNANQGASTEDTIYLNLKNNKDKKMIIATLFHEYRHLIQYKEIKVNHDIYSDKIRKLLALNFYKTPFKYDYSYASYEEVSYHNGMFYNLQPCEFDAEYFSKDLLKRVSRNFKKHIKIDFNKYYNGTFSDVKFFDNQRMSLISFKNFLKLDRVRPRLELEKKAYKILIEKINKMETYKDAIDIYHTPMFIDLPPEDKIGVYQKISGEEIQLYYKKEEKQVVLNGVKYGINEINDYLLLEKILHQKYKLLLKKGKIKPAQYNEFMYMESRAFKMKKYSIENYCCAFQYHSCFDKYCSLMNKKKKSNSSKRKK